MTSVALGVLGPACCLPVLKTLPLTDALFIFLSDSV